MTKYYAANNEFYIFAAPKQNASQDVTFTVAGSPSGTVTVVDENRTLTLTNGQFTDNFADQNAAHIYRLSNTAGPADTSPPTVSLTAPANSATVSGGSVTLSANASDDVGVAGVQFKVDGSNAGSEDTTSPYSISWNSALVANGSHTITAVARDAAGNSTTSSSISVTVSNAPDSTPPTVSITAPTAGATVSGSSVSLTANAADNVGVAGVQFKLDGNNLLSEDTSSPYSINWDTTTTTNGTHTLTAVARDAAGNSITSSTVSVTVSNVGAPGGALLLGNQTVQGSNDANGPGSTEGFRYVAVATGTAGTLSFYVGTGNGATSLRVGVYSDNAGANFIANNLGNRTNMA
jgi:hypothetical protein